MTATGWTFDQLNESSFSDIAELLGYWRDEPPAHVLLALRYLGPSKNARRAAVDEDQARDDMAALGGMMGKQAQPLPPHLKDLVRSAELMKKQHKGIEA